MICTRPIRGTRLDDGTVVNREPRPGEKPGKVRCGKCPSCVLEKASDWACRLSHELVTSSSAAFVTLTYDKEHLPEDGSLVKKDVSDFMKRLRESVGPFVATSLESTAV